MSETARAVDVLVVYGRVGQSALYLATGRCREDSGVLGGATRPPIEHAVFFDVSHYEQIDADVPRVLTGMTA